MLNQIPNLFQIVLNSSKALQKDRFYKFIKNIFGEGLLTAPGLYVIKTLKICMCKKLFLNKVCN